MMTLCPSCGTVVRVFGEDADIDSIVGEQSQFWPNNYVCPKCGAASVAVRPNEVRPEMFTGIPGETLFELTVQDMLMLQCGLGLPDERVCSAEAVRELFRTGIKSVGCRQDTSGVRVLVDWIEVADGTRLFFGSSPSGAIVHRIRKPLMEKKWAS